MQLSTMACQICRGHMHRSAFCRKCRTLVMSVAGNQLKLRAVGCISKLACKNGPGMLTESHRQQSCMIEQNEMGLRCIAHSGCGAWYCCRCSHHMCCVQLQGERLCRTGDTTRLAVKSNAVTVNAQLTSIWYWKGERSMQMQGCTMTMLNMQGSWENKSIITSPFHSLTTNTSSENLSWVLKA